VERKILVNTAQPCNEVIFERANSTLGGVATMGTWRDELIVDSFSGQEIFEGLRTFIIETLELGTKACPDQAGVYSRVGGENTFAGSTAHWFSQNTVAVVVVEN